MIEKLTATVYRAPTARRRYFTVSAACEAEARAIIKRKYPNERPEYDDGHLTFPGWHWAQMENSEKLLRRMTRLVRASMLAGQAGDALEGGDDA